jgi:hypothetical protein
VRRISACGDYVERWNLAGDRLWARWLKSCSAGWATAGPIAVDPASHHLRIGGELSGTVDLGSGPVTSRGGGDGFVADVRP